MKKPIAKKNAPPKIGAWKQIGVVSVDSGMLVIMDPCYIKTKITARQKWLAQIMGRKPKAEWDHYEELYCMKSGAYQFKHAKGHPGLAVSFSTGFGDGTYRVLAHKVTFPNGRTQLAEVKVSLRDPGW